MKIWSDLTGITVSCRKAGQAVASLFEHYVVQGEVETFLGFNFIRTQRIGTDSNSDDKDYSTQVFASMTIGATRMQEKLVGYIECDPS